MGNIIEMLCPSTSSDAMSEEFAGYEIYLAILAILLTVLVAAGLQPVVLLLMARVAGGHVALSWVLSLAVGWVIVTLTKFLWVLSSAFIISMLGAFFGDIGSFASGVGIPVGIVYTIAFIITASVMASIMVCVVAVAISVFIIWQAL